MLGHKLFARFAWTAGRRQAGGARAASATWAHWPDPEDRCDVPERSCRNPCLVRVPCRTVWGSPQSFGTSPRSPHHVAGSVRSEPGLRVAVTFRGDGEVVLNDCHYCA